jgi:hypothetical protein
VVAQTLGIPYFKARRFRRTRALADSGKKVIWKNIAMVKRTAGPL